MIDIPRSLVYVIIGIEVRRIGDGICAEDEHGEYYYEGTARGIVIPTPFEDLGLTLTHYVYVQPFDDTQIVYGVVDEFEYLINDQWLTFAEVMALPLP